MRPAPGRLHTRLDPDRWFGLRLTLGASAAFLLAVPFAALLLLVESAWDPLEDVDVGTADSLHDAATQHPLLVDLLQGVSVVFAPLAFQVVIGAVVVRLLARRRPRLAWWAAVTMAVGGTAGVLLKHAVGRARPVLPEPVASASGLSFPSGHALNSMLGCAVLMLVFVPRLRGRPRAFAWALATAVVLATGFSRVGLGVHYVSDVVAGWVVALATVAATTAAFQSWRPPGKRPGRATGHSRAGRPRRAAVIVNPIHTYDVVRLRAEMSDRMRGAGWGEPLWLETTVAETGAAQARQAVAWGADVVIAYGGDGTVMSCATGLAHTGVPLAVIPAGTANLLVRNLGLPRDAGAALHTALDGSDRQIDLGRIGTRYFTAMAGIGFDAAMMAETPADLKRRLGWPAYVLSGAKHLRDRHMSVTLTLDDGEPVRRHARVVVVGNVGRLQGGIQLMPNAEPDDGYLDVVVVNAGGVIGWSRVAARVVTRRRRGDDRLERFRARRVRVESTREEPRELDGDLIEPGRTLEVDVAPGALLVRVPKPPGS